MLSGVAITVSFFAPWGASLRLLHRELEFWWELALLIVIMLLGHWVEMRSLAQTTSAGSSVSADGNRRWARGHGRIDGDRANRGPWRRESVTAGTVATDSELRVTATGDDTALGGHPAPGREGAKFVLSSPASPSAEPQFSGRGRDHHGHATALLPAVEWDQCQHLCRYWRPG